MFLIIIAFIISARIAQPGYDFLKETNGQFLILSLLVIWYVSTKSTRLYDEFRSRNISFELIAFFKNLIIILISTMVILFLLKEEDLSRGFVILFNFFILILLSIEKILFRIFLNSFRRKGRNLRNMLIIGAGSVGKSFYDLVLQNPHFGYRAIGFLDDQKKTYLNGQYLGKINELDKILSEKNVDNVIIALPNRASDKIEEILRTCEKYTTSVRIIPNYFKFISSKYNVTMFGRFPVISVRDDRINELHWRMLKRGFDFIFTLFVFIFIFTWAYPLIALLVKLSSPGPVLYSQERWGRNNKKFIAYKFRTMWTDKCGEIDEKGNFVQAEKDDPRITKIGRILRKTNLDELPQFWNVLKGEMSIVGPRPHPTPLNIESKDKIHRYMLRHLVKPGITGWAQVNGFRGSTKDISLMQKRIDHDLWYIENWSFGLDMQIIALTVWNMILGDKNAY
jgi:putative colanic acid biosynthesis UDP-glucose lipid carrier transferase